MSCLYILEINLLSNVSFANIFSHSEGCLFIWFMVSFAVQKLLSFIRSHFLIGLFVYLILSCMSCLYILEINPLSVASFANIFSHSVGGLFVLFMVSLDAQKLISVIRSHLFIFAFIYIVKALTLNHWRQLWTLNSH